MLSGVFDGLRDEYLFGICEDILGCESVFSVEMFDGKKQSLKILR